MKAWKGVFEGSFLMKGSGNSAGPQNLYRSPGTDSRAEILNESSEWHVSASAKLAGSRASKAQRVAEANKLLRVCARIALFMSCYFTNLMTKEQEYKNKFITAWEHWRYIIKSVVLCPRELGLLTWWGRMSNPTDNEGTIIKRSIQVRPIPA